MKRIISSVFIMLACGAFLYAASGCGSDSSSSPYVTIGGDGIQGVSSIAPTSDGGYLITGYVQASATNAYLVKTNANGAVQWSRTFDSSYNICTSATESSDGSYITAGSGYYSYIADIGPSAYINKLDSSGTELWTQTYAGLGNAAAYSVAEAQDGGIVITGPTGPGYHNTGYPSDGSLYLLKTDTNGTEQWLRTYGEVVNTVGVELFTTSDGGFIVVGNRYNGSSESIYILKTDANGIEQWHGIYKTANGVFAVYVQETSDGGFVVVGRIYLDSDNAYDAFILKVDAGGTEQWFQTLGGPDWEYASMVRETSDGGLIISGATTYLNDDYRSVPFLHKTDANGNEQWHRTYEFLDVYQSALVLERPGGGYMVAGSAKYNTGIGGVFDVNIFLLKTNAEGFAY
jgi:hypothetical protein